MESKWIVNVRILQLVFELKKGGNSQNSDTTFYHQYNSSKKTILILSYIGACARTIFLVGEGGFVEVENLVYV
jgi:hypothetical protein